MIIAADTRTFNNTNDTSFLSECMFLLSVAHPLHQFILLADQLPLHNPGYGTNVTFITMGPLPANAIAFRLWYNYRLPALLNKYSADIFIGDGYVSLRTKRKQCLLYNLMPYQKTMTSFFDKADSIITHTELNKKNIGEKNNEAAEKITVIYPLPDKHFRVIDWKEKELIKKKYTEEKEYFIYSGRIHTQENFIMLLKAFSYFKKWQKSNMQLIIVSHVAAREKTFLQPLETYKYRQEVKLLVVTDKTELAALTAAAYACIDLNVPGEYEPILNAIMCGIPAVLAASPVAEELFSDSVLYAGNDFETLGRQLVLLYKDENKRNGLMAAANEQLKKFDAGIAAKQLWETIIRTTA